MNYQQEYDEYWSRPDRWGSHSFPESPSDIADQIERICGRGRVLDVGSGMGLLVRTLTDRGNEAHGLDIAQRVVDEGNRQLPGRFHVGSILSLPFPDGSFDTVVSTDCLEHIAEADVPKAAEELYRISRRFAFIRLATTPDRDGRWHLTIRDREWWENQFLAAGFRKHPLSQLIVPYEALENEGWQVTILLEKIPADALTRYPLAALKAERDLHMDMLRESGRRSDAHIARYMLAREHLPKAGLVLDAACGLGYGSALLARSAGPSVRVVGLDVSDYAVDYARANFLPLLPNAEFNHGDVTDLSRFADSSVDLVVSFETVEHLREPSAFLREVNRVLKPEGHFICSVPNLWVDETGKDPSPWHFHVFDFAKLAALIRQCCDLKAVYSQTAGGGRILPDAPRSLRQVPFPAVPANVPAEWWLAVALPRKAACSVAEPSADAIDPLLCSRLDTPAPAIGKTIWLLCSNSNHVKLFAPLAKELKVRGWKPTFFSLDNFYGQGSARALQELRLERLELPTLTPDRNWHERTQQERVPWNAEATAAVQAMFEANAPHVLLVGNDTGFLEQLFIGAARRSGVRTALLQEGALRSPSVDAATGQQTTVMGDGDCELICTWGEGLANRLRDRGVGSIIEPVGNPLFDLPLPPRPARQGNRETILLIGQCFGKYGEYSLEQEHAVYEQLIRAIVQRGCYRLFFKLHPQQDAKYYTELHQRLGQTFELMSTGESLASIQSADLVVSVASTMALEAFRLGVPTLTLHYLAPFEVPDLVRLPGGCQSEADFYRFLDHPESWKGLRSDLEEDAAVTRDLFCKLDGQACRRMADAIEKLINFTPSNLAILPASGSKATSLQYNPSPAAKNMTTIEFNEQTGPGWTILKEMYDTKVARDLAGNVRQLELAGVSPETGKLLYDLVRRHHPRQTLETGFAYGFSTLFILQALADNGGGRHEAIDPVETARWHGIGLANVKRAGFEHLFEHLEMPSQLILPSHLHNQFQLDIAFIDGSHLFDETLLDAYYVDRMLALNGLIVLDDWDWMPAVRAAANFIETNLPYRVMPSPEAPKVRVLQKIEAKPRAWNHFVPFDVPSAIGLNQPKPPAAPQTIDRLSALTSNRAANRILSGQNCQQP